MGIIDWPTPVLSNTAYFKAEPDLPNGRGSTRQYRVPKVESKILGLESGRTVSVKGYDPKKEKSIRFEKELFFDGTNYGFTVPLRKIDLEVGEFSRGSYQQFMVRGGRLVKYFPNIPIKRIHQLALFKASPTPSMMESESSLHITIPKREKEYGNISKGDEVLVTMQRVSEESEGKFLESLNSVNRSVFSASIAESGEEQSSRFTIPAKRRRVKGYSPEDVYQVALTKRD